MKGFIVTVILSLVFMALWYFYDHGINLAFFPISVPAYLFLVSVGSTNFIAIPLLLYAAFIVVLFAWLSKRPNRKRIILSAAGILAIIHLVAFQITVRAFGKLGTGIVEQMLQRQ